MSAVQPTAEPNSQTIESRRAAVSQSVLAGATLTAPYLGMNVAAAFIAGFGLMENSPAVIIGAMLIAMLFGPIVGIAMALAKADMPLLSRALCRGCWSCVCSCRRVFDRPGDPTTHDRQRDSEPDSS